MNGEEEGADERLERKGEDHEDVSGAYVAPTRGGYRTAWAVDGFIIDAAIPNHQLPLTGCKEAENGGLERKTFVTQLVQA
jgi:hypothetical protein